MLAPLRPRENLPLLLGAVRRPFKQAARGVRPPSPKVGPRRPPGRRPGLGLPLPTRPASPGHAFAPAAGGTCTHVPGRYSPGSRVHRPRIGGPFYAPGRSAPAAAPGRPASGRAAGGDMCHLSGTVSSRLTSTSPADRGPFYAPGAPFCRARPAPGPPLHQLPGGHVPMCRDASVPAPGYIARGPPPIRR